MTCLRDNQRGADLLIGYLEGTLPEVELRDLERHAAACEDCRGLLAVQAELGAELEGEETPQVSADFDAKLYARIAAERPWWNVSWKLAMPAAAAAMVAVAVWVRQPEPAAEPVVSQEVQQLEQALDDLELLMPL